MCQNQLFRYITNPIIRIAIHTNWFIDPIIGRDMLIPVASPIPRPINPAPACFFIELIGKVNH